MEYATLKCVYWLNNRHLLEPVGAIPPAEAEASYYTALDTVAVALQLKKN